MDQKDQIDKIESYLNHELSDVERAEFEAALKKDVHLAEELGRRQAAHTAIDYLIAEDLRTELKAMEKEATQTPIIPLRKRKIFPLAIAATLIILVGAFFFINPWGPSSPTDSILAYYEAPDDAMRSSTGDELPTELVQARQSIQARAFDAAIRQLQTVSPDDQHYIYAQYLLGHAYFGKEEYAAAQQSFEFVIERDDLRYKEEADWYGLLGCLMHGSMCMGKWETLILNEDHSYHQNALELRDKLK